MVNPTYHSLGDHSESIEIDYDPTMVSYRDLLKIFWEGHDPAARSWSTQYKAAVFYHNDEQKRLAEETRERIEATRKIKCERRFCRSPRSTWRKSTIRSTA